MTGRVHWDIPFFVLTPPPLWMVSDFQPDFFSFCSMEGSGFSTNIAISSIPSTGFCVCKGMDGLGFPEKVAVSSIPLSDLSNIIFVWSSVVEVK